MWGQSLKAPTGSIAACQVDVWSFVKNPKPMTYHPRYQTRINSGNSSHKAEIKEKNKKQKNNKNQIKKTNPK